MKDWIECQSCQSEFKVVTLIGEPICFCPLCGAEISRDEDEGDMFDDE